MKLLMVAACVPVFAGAPAEYEIQKMEFSVMRVEKGVRVINKATLKIRDAACGYIRYSLPVSGIDPDSKNIKGACFVGKKEIAMRDWEYTDNKVTFHTIGNPGNEMFATGQVCEVVLEFNCTLTDGKSLSIVAENAGSWWSGKWTQKKIDKVVLGGNARVCLKNVQTGTKVKFDFPDAKEDDGSIEIVLPELDK